LFSANGTLCVMRKKPDGERYRADDHRGGTAEDQKAVVDTIRIENDGGDW